MSAPRSFYLGPTKQRLLASSWDDIVSAAGAGVLDETHWCEVKRDIPAASRPANRELAKDLASLSVDGGVLVVGIEDNNGAAGNVVGTNLSGLADRITQVASGIIDPPLPVTTQAFEQTASAGHSVLVVTVPASLSAPHMVDGSYWGRNDTGKRKLGDDEVRRLLATRASRAQGFETRLRRLADDLDPVNAADRHHGHLYLLLEPAAAILGRRLTEEIGQRQALQLAMDAVTIDSPWQPHFRELSRTINHPSGIAGTSLAPGRPIDDEYKVLYVLMLDDGTVQVAAGAGTTPVQGEGSEEVIYTGHVLQLAHAAIQLAAHLATTYLAYEGPWQIGIYLDQLRGLHSFTAYIPGSFGGPAYPEGEYLRIAESTTGEMRETPQHVVQRLVSGLLRALGDERRFLPYEDPNEIVQRLRR